MPLSGIYALHFRHTRWHRCVQAHDSTWHWGASFFEDVPLVEFTYPVFTRISGGVSAGHWGLCRCVPRLLSAIILPFVCWFYPGTLGLLLFQIISLVGLPAEPIAHKAHFLPARWQQTHAAYSASMYFIWPITYHLSPITYHLHAWLSVKNTLSTFLSDSNKQLHRRFTIIDPVQIILV